MKYTHGKESKRNFVRTISEFFRRDKGKYKNRNYDLSQHSFPVDQNFSGQKTGSLWRFLKPGASRKRSSIGGYSSGAVQTRWFSRYVLISVCLLVAGLLIWGQAHVRILEICKNISFFKVHILVISGAEKTGRERIRDLSGIIEGKTSLIGLDANAIKAKVASDSWVGQVEVAKKWPSTVTIDIVEHKPVALLNSGEAKAQKLYFIDNKGFSFLETRSGQDMDFPVITGLDKITDKQEKDAVFTEIMVLLKKAAKNNPNLPAQSVSEISVSPQGELTLYMVDYPFPIFFGKGRPTEKFSHLLRVLEKLYKNRDGAVEISQVAFIRLEYENDQVLVIKKSG